MNFKKIAKQLSKKDKETIGKWACQQLSLEMKRELYSGKRAMLWQIAVACLGRREAEKGLKEKEE